MCAESLHVLNETGATMLNATDAVVPTNGDFARCVAELTGETSARRRDVRAEVTVLLIRPSGGSLLRTGFLTPYTAETISRDALHSGPGTRLLVKFPTWTDDAEVERLVERLAWLRDRGVQVGFSRVAWSGRRR